MIIKVRSFMVTLLIIMLFLGEIFSTNVEILKYIDEIACIISLIYIILKIGLKKTFKDREDRILLILITCVTLIGILGNITSGIEKKVFYIIVDIISTTKVIIIYIVIKNFLTPDTAKKVSQNLFIFSKLFLILSAFFGIMSLFKNLGMTGEVRYGIGGYYFIFKHQHILAIYVMSSLLFVILNEKKDKKKKMYIILSIISQLLTTKGPSIIWCALIIMFSRYYRRRKKISIIFIVVIVILSLIIGQYQINTYFKNANAPRAILLKYSIITANKYFPLGTGFSTYGSEMAWRDYSVLYILYGFNNLYGMSENNGAFLNDNYWPMLLGQTGYFGAIIMLFVYIILFRKFQKKYNDKDIKSVFISNYVYIMFHSLGSAAITSSAGVFLFITFAITEKIYTKDEV